MYISKAISYLKGWEILQSDDSNIYQDIVDTLNEITPASLTNSKISRPYFNSNEEIVPINTYSFSRSTDYFLHEKGWKDYRIRPSVKGGFRLFVKNLRNKISVRTIADNHSSSFNNLLFVECPKMYENNITTVSVLLVPEEEIRMLLSTDRSPMFFSMDHCIATLNDVSPLTLSSPFVIIGFTEEDNGSIVQIETIEPDENVINDTNTIYKSIEFHPEHYQAGVSILSYFGEILKQKYPESNAKVRIEQDNNTVRLIVISSNGEKEIIEKTLEDYSLVIAEKEEPSILLKDDLAIMALSNKLEMAKMEIRQTKELMSLSTDMKNTQINYLQDDILYLRNQLGTQLSGLDKSHELASNALSLNNKLIEVTINQNSILFEDLRSNRVLPSHIERELSFIKMIIEKDLAKENEKELKVSLRIIKDDNPEILSDLGDVLKNSMYGVSGNVMFTWLQAISNTLS